MTITCATDEQFYNAVAACVARGLRFTANANNLTITLNGGF